MFLSLLLFFWFCFSLYGDHRDLHVLTHSFPTRRTSELSSTRRPSITPRSITSSIWPRIPPAIAGWAAPASVVPLALAYRHDYPVIFAITCIFCENNKIGRAHV